MSESRKTQRPLACLVRLALSVKARAASRPTSPLCQRIAHACALDDLEQHRDFFKESSRTAQTDERFRVTSLHKPEPGAMSR